jgi:hypothetical protein
MMDDKINVRMNVVLITLVGRCYCDHKEDKPPLAFALFVRFCFEISLASRTTRSREERGREESFFARFLLQVAGETCRLSDVGGV